MGIARPASRTIPCIFARFLGLSAMIFLAAVPLAAADCPVEPAGTRFRSPGESAVVRRRPEAVRGLRLRREHRRHVRRTVTRNAKQVFDQAEHGAAQDLRPQTGRPARANTSSRTARCTAPSRPSALPSSPRRSEGIAASAQGPRTRAWRQAPLRPGSRPWPFPRSPGTPPARGWPGPRAPCGRPARPPWPRRR